MQRPIYAQSPPLHHPVPQHVSTVPQLRSPPPPTSSQPQQGAYGNPYQQGAPPGSGNVFGGYGNFMNDPAAQIGVQLGQNAFKAGQEYFEHNVGGGLSTTPMILQGREVQVQAQSADIYIYLTGEPVDQLLRAQALLQRVEPICRQQTHTSAVPLAA